MTHLQHSDHLALLDCLLELSASRGLDDLRRRAVAALRRLVPCDIASYLEIRPGVSARSLVEPSGIHSPECEEILAHNSLDNPVFANLHRGADAQVHRISDFIGQRELHRRELYQHLYRRVGIEYQIALPFPAGKSSIVAIALSRGRRDFDDQERHLLELARPHLVQARANAILFDQLQSAMAHDGRAMVVLDERDRVCFATGAAERLLDAYLGGSGGQGSVLPDGLRHWIHLARSWRAAGRDISARPGEIVAELEGRRLAARLLPDGRATDLADDEDVVLLEETRDLGNADLASLGLSTREADVLCLVAQGKTDGEIAEILVVSPRTVQKHLEHVYRKLGVKTRTAAVGLIGGRIRGDGPVRGTVDLSHPKAA